MTATQTMRSDWSWRAGGRAPVTIPTRTQVLMAPMHFGGQTVTLPGYGTIPWFDAALFSLDAAGRHAVYQMKRAAGDQFVMAALWWAYQSGDGYVYPVNDGVGVNWARDWAGFKALIQETITEGFYVDAKLACEGQHVVTGQLGYPWAMDNAYAFAHTMTRGFDVTPWVVWSWGFELFGPGGDWSDQQVTNAHLTLRDAFGPNALIGVEFGQGYNKWNAGQADPDSGPECWATPAGLAIDVFQQEFPQPIYQGAGTYGPDDHWFGCEILSAANLGPGYTGDASHFSHAIPWYLQASTPRGPHVAWGYEYGLYDWVRGRISPDDYAQMRSDIRSLGYTVVG